MYFELIGEISDIERIARGPSIRERARLRKQFDQRQNCDVGWIKTLGTDRHVLPDERSFYLMGDSGRAESMDAGLATKPDSLR